MSLRVRVRVSEQTKRAQPDREWCERRRSKRASIRAERGVSKARACADQQAVGKVAVRTALRAA